MALAHRLRGLVVLFCIGVAAVAGAAPAAATPSVTWVSTLPPNTTTGQSYSATWNIANGSPSHTNLHWDTSNPQNCSASANPPCSTNAVSGGPGNYSASFLAPSVSSPTTYYVAAHAIINGVDYWSAWTATTVNPVAATPSVTWVSTPPSSTTAGQSYSTTWNIANGSPSHTNLHWDTSNPQYCSPSANPPCSTNAVSGGPGNYSASFPAPSVSSPTTYYVAAHAIINGVDYWSPTVATTVSPVAATPSVTWVSTPPSSTTAGQSYSATWNIANGSPSHTNLHWDTSNPQNCSPSANPPCSTNAVSGGPGNYSASFLAPSVSSPTTTYVAAHAVINGVDYWSPTVATTVSPAAAAPSVTWVSTLPPNTTAGQSYSATWNIANGSPSHTNLHWDTSNPQNCSPSANPPCSTNAVSGGPGNYSASFLAPSVSSPTTYYVAAHAVINGVDYWSPTAATTVSPVAATPSVTWVSTPPASTIAGQSYAATWNIANGSPSHTNLHWDTSNPQNCSPSANPPCSTNAVSGGPGNYSASFLAPSVSSPTTYYVAAHAVINGVDYWSPTVTTTVTPAAQGPGRFTLSANSRCNSGSPSVQLTWTVSDGAATYVVYRNGSPYSGTLSSSSTSYNDNTNVLAGQTYSYLVRAANSAGTNDSNIVPITVPSDICTSPPPGCFTLSTSVSPAGSGTVTVGTATNCASGYTSGTAIALKAVAASGYVFSGWSTSSGAFADPSSSQTTLTISGNTAVTASFVVTPTSSGRPSAAFSFSPAHPGVGELVIFRDTSTGQPTSWAWDFTASGAADSTAQNPAYSFPVAGPHQVTLKVSNAYGEDRATQTIQVAAPAGAPSVTRVTRQYAGVFLSGTDIDNRFDVKVDWQGDPGKVSFSINGDPGKVVAGSASGASLVLHMADLPASRSASTVVIVPTNAAGALGKPWTEHVYIFPYPAWLKLALGRDPGSLGIEASGGVVKANLHLDIPYPHLGAKGPAVEIPDWIPYLGGKFGLKETFGRISGSVESTGHGSLSVSGETGFTAMDDSISGRVSGGGEFDFFPPRGLKLTDASFGVDLSGTIGKEVGLLEAIPALASLNSFPPLRWLNKSATLKGEISPRVGVTARFSQGDDDDLDFSAATGTLGLDLTGTLKVCFLGDHLCARAWLSGSGEGTVGVPEPLLRDLKVSFQAAVELTAHALLELHASAEYDASCEWKAESGTSCSAKPSTSNDSIGNPVERPLSAIPVRPIGRDYSRFGQYSVLHHQPVAVVAAAKSRTAGTSQTLTLISNLFTGASPTLIEVGSGRLLLWVQQNPTLPVLQSTDIAWSYNDGSGWTDPSTIVSDTRADLSPVAGVDTHGRVVAAWLRIKDQQFDTPIKSLSDLPLFYNRLEVVSAVFDPASRTWGTVTPLTDDNAMDIDPHLSSDGAGHLLLTWLSNPAGEFFSTPANPSTLKFSLWSNSGWTPAAPLATGLIGVGDHAPAFRGDRGVIIVPREPAPSSPGVLDLYTWNGAAWSGPVMLEADGVENRHPSVAYDAQGEAHIVWLRGRDLAHATVRRSAPEVIRPGSTSLAFYGAKLLTGSQGFLTLIWQEVVDNGPASLFATSYDPQSATWSADLRLSDDPIEAHAFCGYFGSDGLLHGAYLATQIDRTTATVGLSQSSVTIGNIPVEGQTDLRLFDRALVSDLATSDQDLTVVPSSPLPGDRVTLTLVVHNAGDFAVRSFLVRLYAGDPASGVVLANQTVPGPVRAGEDRTVSFVFTYPATPIDLVAVVDPDNQIAELTKRNNRARAHLADAAPTARILASSTSGTAPLTVRFDGSSNVTDAGAAASYTWAFADGNPGGTGATVYHTFASPGTYPVTLVVTDRQGRVATAAVNIVVATGSPVCLPGPTDLCLNRGRFYAGVVWTDPFGGGSGVGTAVPLTDDTGYFWFFAPGNVELVLKVLDGRGVNGNFWVFYGALSSVEYVVTVLDSQTGVTRTYHNLPFRLASVADTQAFHATGAPSRVAANTQPFSAITVPAGLDPDSSPVLDLSAEAPQPTTQLREASGFGCAQSSTALCLSDKRFRLEVQWTDFNGRSGSGQAVALTQDTGYFWFFSSSNTELVIKVLDGRGVNGHFWVFYGALSTVDYIITVTDTLTGAVRTYHNPPTNLASVADTSAF
ncbi:MAG TPA: PKD domain-containing protein [Thermoanaerobaculia bacterium]|nr:PKD domain-containing protein [Thermoanaerobaculia bacterium]